MRYSSNFLISAACLLLLSGCGTAGSSPWRSDARHRFSWALSAGAEEFAPEETDNIRRTISLADRYHQSEMVEDADRLYQLSSQKCQLLYRNLILSKVAGGTTLSLESEQGQLAEEIEIAREHIRLEEVLQKEYATNPANQPDQSTPAVPGKTQKLADRFSPTSERKPTSRFKVQSNPVSVKEAPRQTTSAGTTIYLTFDDGPSRLTLPIATFLKSEGIQATFFVLGSNIKGREKAITATIAMGHRVGNHTLSHNLQKLMASLDSDASEVRRTSDMIERLGGDGKMVRIPYGASSKTIISHVAAEGAQIFDWDINSNDSTQRGVRDPLFIEKTVLSRLNKSKKKHVILLFHDGAGHASTLEALRDMIPRLKQEGYRFGLLARSEKIAQSTESRHTAQ